MIWDNWRVDACRSRLVDIWGVQNLGGIVIRILGWVLLAIALALTSSTWIRWLKWNYLLSKVLQNYVFDSIIIEHSLLLDEIILLFLHLLKLLLEIDVLELGVHVIGMFIRMISNVWVELTGSTILWGWSRMLIWVNLIRIYEVVISLSHALEELLKNLCSVLICCLLLRIIEIRNSLMLLLLCYWIKLVFKFLSGNRCLFS